MTSKELKTALKDNDFRKFVRMVKLDEMCMPGYENTALIHKKTPFHEIIRQDS